MNVDVLATIDERDQTNDLESEEERIVRGATPEEELKAKQLSDKAHADETLQSNCNFARTNFTTETQRARRGKGVKGDWWAERLLALDWRTQAKSFGRDIALAFNESSLRTNH